MKINRFYEEVNLILRKASYLKVNYKLLRGSNLDNLFKYVGLDIFNYGDENNYETNENEEIENITLKKVNSSSVKKIIKPVKIVKKK